MSDLTIEPLVEHLGHRLHPARADGLLEAAGEGDKAAFGVFFDWTSPVIFGCIRRATGGPREAEQLTENVYVGLWRSAPRFGASGRSAHERLLDFTRCELLRWHLLRRLPECAQRPPTLRPTP